jgi:hypothetical protein
MTSLSQYWAILYRAVAVIFFDFAAVHALQFICSLGQFRRERAPLLIFAPIRDAAGDGPH